MYTLYTVRWSRSILDWLPAGGHRLRARPVTRWADCVEKVVTTAMTGSSMDWKDQSSFASFSQLAQDRETWAMLEDDFLNFCK